MNTIQDAVLAKLQELSLEHQSEVLNFVESLHHQSHSKSSRQSLQGLWAGFAFEITEEDISEIRQEMWADFPRDDF